jgi:hypothetical protein
MLSMSKRGPFRGATLRRAIMSLTEYGVAFLLEGADR